MGNSRPGKQWTTREGGYFFSRTQSLRSQVGDIESRMNCVMCSDALVCFAGRHKKSDIAGKITCGSGKKFAV